MTKQELMETYTAEQLAEMVINFNRLMDILKYGENFLKSGLFENPAIAAFESKIKIMQYENDCLQSEIEKYRKAFEDSKKERDCQIAEYQKKIEELCNSLRTLDGNLKVSNVVIEETIKNENGEESNTVKFESIKQFAEYIRCFYTINIDYIQKILRGCGQKENDVQDISDFLPTEPIKVADMLISAEGEYEHNSIAKALYRKDKGAYRIFDIGELKQIAEHLIVYCNHNKEVEE